MSTPLGFSYTLFLLSDPRQCHCVHSLLIFCRATPDMPSSFWFCRTPPPPDTDVKVHVYKGLQAPTVTGV
uniref:Uncharacterized protein n=1 Tax=Meloidogyne enterolobii TaxID=390850 RepID=A0A6V7VW90_MELEN|nr:unnamed protein product [Meloidogyne enterolobii]